MKTNEQNLEAVISRSPIPVILDCYADWCEPCKKLTPVLETLVSDLLLVLLALGSVLVIILPWGAPKASSASVPIPPPTLRQHTTQVGKYPGRLLLAKLNVDTYQEVAMSLQVRSLPSVFGIV